MNEMEIVRMFNSELSSIYESKPPVSKAKMSSITRCAVKALKYYKHVVHSVEKFIQKCRPEYKVPGLYVIDSIVRQSRHQFGPERDLFGPRFGKNIQATFLCVYGCAPEEKPKVVRVLNLWQKNGVYPPEVIQPLIDMASEQTLPFSKDGTTQAMTVSSLAAVHTPTKSSSPSSQDTVMTRIEQQRQQQEMQIQQLQQQLEQQKQQQLILEQQLQLQLAQQQQPPQQPQPPQQQYQQQDRHLQQQANTQITAGGEGGPQQPQLQIDPALFSQIRALTGQLQHQHQGQSTEENRSKFLGNVGTLLGAGRLPPNPVTDSQGHEADLWSVTGINASNTSTSSHYDQGHLQTGTTPQGKSPGFNKALLDAFDYGDEEDDEQRLAEQRRHLMEDEKRLAVRSRESPQNPSGVLHRIQDQFRQQQQQSGESLTSNDTSLESNGHPAAFVGAAGDRFGVGMGGRPAHGYPALDGVRSESHGAKEKFETEGSVGQALGGTAFVTTDPSRLEKPELHRSREGTLNDNTMLPRGPMMEGRHAFSQEVRYPEDKYKERLQGGPSENKAVLREEGLLSLRVGCGRGDVPFGSLRGTRGDLSEISDNGGKTLPGERYPEHGLHNLPQERRFPGDFGGEPPFRERSESRRSPSRESWLSRAHSKPDIGPDDDGQESRIEQKRKDDQSSERPLMTPEERKRQGYPALRRNTLSLCTITVWVGHLNKQTLQSQLKEVFETYGEVSSIDLVQARGCAFIVMKERKAAAAAIQHLRNRRINGHTVKLAWAPGKAIKGSEFKRYWDEDRGVTYIPWSKLDGVNLKEITDGAVIDPDSAPPGFSLSAEDETEKKRKEESEELEEEGSKEQEASPSVLPPSVTSVPPFPGGIPPRMVPMPFHPGQIPPPPGIFPFPPAFRPPLPGMPPHLVPPPLGLRPDLVGITSHPMAGRLRGPMPSPWSSEPGVASITGERKRETEVDATREQTEVVDGDVKEVTEVVSKEEGALDQTPTDVDMVDESQMESKEGTLTQEKVVAPPAPWMSMVRPPLTRPTGERWSGLPHGIPHPSVVRMMARPPQAPFVGVQPGPRLLPPGPRHVMESSLQRYPHGSHFPGPGAPIFPQRMPPIGMRGPWAPAEVGDDIYAASNEESRFHLGGLQYRKAENEEKELGMRSISSDKPPRRSKWDNGSVPENEESGERSTEGEKIGDWEQERDKERDSDRDRYSDRDRDREREKDRERDRERNRDREKDRDRERERERGRDRDKERERGRDRDKERDSSHSRHKDRDGDRDRERSRRERERGRYRDQDRERGRGRDKDRDSDRPGRRERERDRDRDQSRDREREKRDRDRRREKDSDRDSRDEFETTDTKGCSPAQKEDLVLEPTEVHAAGDKRGVSEEQKAEKSVEDQPKFKRTRWEEVTIVPQKSVIETIEANKVGETCAEERRDFRETEENCVQEQVQADGDRDVPPKGATQNAHIDVVDSLIEGIDTSQGQNLSEEKATGLQSVVDEEAAKRAGVHAQEKSAILSVPANELGLESSSPRTPCATNESKAT